MCVWGGGGGERLMLYSKMYHLHRLMLYSKMYHLHRLSIIFTTPTQEQNEKSERQTDRQTDRGPKSLLDLGSWIPLSTQLDPSYLLGHSQQPNTPVNNPQTHSEAVTDIILISLGGETGPMCTGTETGAQSKAANKPQKHTEEPLLGTQRNVLAVEISVSPRCYR